MASRIDLSGLKPVHELDRLSWRWEQSGSDEIKLRCPAHEDSTPSASMNSTTGNWRCHVPTCGARGDLVAFMAYAAKVDRRVVLVDLQQRHPGLAGIADIPSQTVEKFHAKLGMAGPLLEELAKRAVTPEMMTEARLGFHDGRITIPIFDEIGRCVNVRRYLPGAPANVKMRNTTGFAGPHIFQIDELIGKDKVWICGGEMKALVAKHLLRPLGVGACCSTGGEGHWKKEWLPLLHGKHVFVCMDVDEPGVNATRKLSMLFNPHAKSVRVVKLPLDVSEHPHGDLNDWAKVNAAKTEDMIDLMELAEEWVPPQLKSTPQTDPMRCSLMQASRSELVGALLEVKATVAALDQTPYLVPRIIDVECTKDQPHCDVCPIKHMEEDKDTGWVRAEVPASSPAVLAMMGSPDKAQRELIMEAIGIPTRCKVMKHHVKTRRVLHDVRLAPSMDLTGRNSADFMLPGVVSGGDVELNVPYTFVGASHPSAKTQQCVFLSHDLTVAEDTLDTFQPTEEDLQQLSLFAPIQWTKEAIDARLTVLYSDLETNVTRIFERRDMHLAVDLAYHSPLFLEFDGRTVGGWLNVLIMGDSSQGKSECCLRLMQHYGVGDRLDCKNATVAGLLGGLEQMGSRWFVKWGAIPQHDRRLLFLEELKGASAEVISKLTDMRSSGIAEIPKIERRRSHARTRLVMISNARSPRPMASFNFGVEAILELMGTLEDVRRIDLAVVVARGEVHEAVTNMSSADRPKVDHIYTSDLCRKLVLWGWTRSGGQVKVEPEAETAVLSGARALCDEFTEQIPLIDRGTTKSKLLKLSAALAVRTFSRVNDDVVIRPCHVEWTIDYIRRVYSTAAIGYYDFSQAVRLAQTVQDPAEVKKCIQSTKHPSDFVKLLLRQDLVTLQDIQAACALTDEDARAILSLLVRKGALIRTGRFEHAKNPDFIIMLKAMKGQEHDLSGQEF